MIMDRSVVLIYSLLSRCNRLSVSNSDYYCYNPIVKWYKSKDFNRLIPAGKPIDD